jgi:hypothetical protein
MNLPDEMEPFFEPLQSLQNLISRFNEKGVVIGGVAAGVLGKARFTEDLDAMILLSTQDIPHLLEAAKQEGMEARIENAAEFAKKSRVLLLRHIITDTNIDISRIISEIRGMSRKRLSATQNKDKRVNSGQHV